MNKLPNQTLLINESLLVERKNAARNVIQNILDQLDFSSVEELNFPDRTMGFEIEIVHDSCMDREIFTYALEKLFNKLGIMSQIDKDDTFSNWCITKDQTVTTPPNFRGLENPEEGIEIVSPILRTQEEKNIYVKLMYGLRSLGFYASSECGSHVWFGVPEFVEMYDSKKLMDAADFVESVSESTPAIHKALSPFLRKSREQTLFSGIPKVGRNYSFIDIGNEQALGEKGKESMINMQYVVARGAMEFRTLGNTMDPLEILKGFQVVEKAIDLIKKSKTREGHEEYMVRCMGELEGPLDAETTRKMLRKAKWADYSIAVKYPGVRFMDGQEFIQSQEALEHGLRRFAPASANFLTSYAKSIFDGHIFMSEKDPLIIEATNKFDEMDNHVIKNHLEKEIKNGSEYSEIAISFLNLTNSQNTTENFPNLQNLIM